MAACALADEQLAMARSRAGVYRFLAGLFLNPIPPEGSQFVRQVQAVISAMPAVEADGEMATGIALLRQAVPEGSAAELAALQLDLAIERTRLCRGVREHAGPRPPYESLFRETSGFVATLLAVVQAYQQAGWAVDAGAHDRPDYLGMELSFMATLCASEPSAAGDAGALLEQERRFVTEHLLAWAPAYCREMLEHARTPFWQGVAHLLLGFLSEEEQLLAGVCQ